jgi:hypothetical protein
MIASLGLMDGQKCKKKASQKPLSRMEA